MASPNEPIAVVGSACRFAGDASSPSRLWELLKDPRDLNREIPNSRFNVNGWYHPDGSYHGHSNVKNAYLVNEDVTAFDAEFFGVKSVEAKTMDPQQRFLMEVAYEGLESAGMSMADVKGSNTAVYVGVMFADYGALLLRDLQETPTYYATGTGNSILSNRISYFFDFHGPSITIDTACSSSMVAVHMAVQALRSGDANMALACGSNLILGPENFIIESKLKMLSPDGLSRMWDQGANGYARGDGVATVVLKTLSAALKDGDHIECIIRETGLNQDGATGGITMPSSLAQEQLIRRTYAKAGLDLLSQSDHPQYFEAHGTGTPAGDPIEAEAIYNTFSTSHRSKDPLYVGSIKTILGHTEGTAGVAAIIKASLALQHGTIPPNLLFDQLSDRVAPFYKNVEIVKAARPWPKIEGGTRRASVNSFGFGGANAHAILESYSRTHSSLPLERNAAPFTPFVFSALSENSLRESLSAYVEVLEHNDSEIDLGDLAYTLRQRRSVFPYRVSLSASSIKDLKAKISVKLQDENANIGIKALPNSKKGVAKLLGIFTGQGAQYARMGAELIEESEFARRVIQKMESDLAQLPDGPKWSLMAEILADTSSSHVQEAAFSQPLCTAIQILMVDLLHLAGVEFDAVVGHSSGEIAAAYAAGQLTSRDAICIAYYRGLHVQVAASPNSSKIKGAMVAVGSSRQDMVELCAHEEFSGRITVAASNSSSSVTVSGDEDAILELQLVLDDEGKFNRRLKVDRAYHSDHMLPCFDPYVESLRKCGITPQKPQSKCIWFSSVYSRPVDEAMQLNDIYWAENMTKPVLFYDAVALAAAAFPCDLVLEVGSHPALKGPASQTIQEITEKDIPYHGVLTRGASAVEAFSTSLGGLWSYLDKSQVNLDSFERAIADGIRQFSVVKGLPTYQWDHKVKYWQESRASRKMRVRQQQVHCLLGDISSDSAPHHICWKNLLRESEMEWLSGHQVQSQTVFPAAGYISSAMEATRFVAEGAGKDIRLIELRDFIIHQAVIFREGDGGIEVLIEMAEITKETDRIRAKFTYSAYLDTNTEDLTLAASANVEILLGEASVTLLPVRKAALPHVIDVEPERFYQALADLGYDFSGRFKSLSSLQRKHHKATCLVKMQPLEHGADSLFIHPAELDAALQSVILAYSYPYDEQLRTLHLPTSIQQIRINPALLGADRSEVEFFPVDSAISDKNAGERGIIGHVNLYSNKGPNAAIQVQGAAFMPLGGSAAAEDRRVFSKVGWVGSQADGNLAADNIPIGEKHVQMVMLLERIATFYLRMFDKIVAADDPLRSEFPTNWYLNYARYVTDMVENGNHKWAKKEWLDDTLEDILEISKPYSETPDIQIMHLTGAQMPRVFAGETTILEQFRANDILDRYYANGFGLSESAQWVSRVVKQIVDRYPHMNILEIGAGTGGATKATFREIGQSFRSYTYTDISAAFFEHAAAIFPQQRDRMVFKTFDAEKGPQEQGFVEGSYDLIIAFFVIHATSDLERALKNIRRLLKPGGFLVVGEGQEGMNGVASSGFIFGTLPGWWLGADKGRTYSPHVSAKEWDCLLRQTGFSGVDAATPSPFEDVLNVYHFVSQAVDDEVSFFREPLATSSWKAPPIKKLVIIGGQTPRSSHLVEGFKNIMNGEFATEFHHFRSLLDIDFEIVDADSTVLSLTELDAPVFKDITPGVFQSLRKIFESGKTILWVTSGRRDDEPYSNMTVGFGRVATNETPELRLQQLDISEPQNTTPETVAEILLRLHVSASIKAEFLQPVEPEIVIDEKKRELVSRLRPIPELNNRYNSASRSILQEVDLNRTPVSLQFGSNGCIINELSNYATSTSALEDIIELRTTHAVLSALKTPFGHKFLVLGLQSGTSIPYLALVPSLSSVLKVSSKSAVPCDIPAMSAGEILTAIAAHLVSMVVLHEIYSGQTLVAYNATCTVAQALTAQSAAKNVTVVYTTNSTNDGAPDSWIKLPRYLSQLELGDIILAQPSLFVGFSNGGTDGPENEATLISILPADCQIITAKTIYSTSGSASGSYVSEKLGERLRVALKYVMDDVNKQEYSSLTIDSLSLESLANGLRVEDPLAIIDFMGTTSLPVQVTRLDASPMFKGEDATYWIVGMSGVLGISLSDWMITRGARNLVLTSRNPKIEPEWIAAHKRKGVTVTVFACDVTNETALKAVHEKICNTLPPIAGAMQGAMVLRDVSLRNMSFEDLNDVIRPKVNGSVYLDRIFYNVDLDFFVLISSINCVIGNMGQANYAAANTFMCSLAAQRRKRGLRAATVNAGAIIGAGYMERESRRALDMIVQKLHMMRMSEEDWCQAISEGIDASRLESPHGPEITTGLSDVPFDTPNAPNWFLNPKFSSFIVQQKTVTEDQNEGKTALSVTERLQGCQSQQEVYKIVEHAFATQLRNVLQMTMSDNELMESRSNDIGLDSLVSVDIRSWFLKNMQVNIPVLKIMGNGTMENLVEFSVENIPAELVPNIGADGPAEDSTSDSSPKRTGDSQASTIPTTPDRSHSPIAQTYSITHLADKVVKEDMGAIDWDAESRPPADLANISLDLDSPPSTIPKVIVLTGVSGLLGHNLLDYLLENTDSKIICIAVRNLPSRLERKELRIHSRVKYYAGELAAPLLGLSEQESSFIFAEADVVIHNGSDTSHLKFFPDMRASNVGSTHTLTRLCLPRRIPMHYISSVGVCVLYNGPEFPEVSVTRPGALQPAADGSFGYMCSKWTNERFLEQVHNLYALKVCIHRPSTIIRQGEDARTARAQLDWVNALLHYMHKIEAAPKVNYNRGALDLVYVKSVCDDILYHIMDTSDRAQKEVTYVHEVGDIVIPMGELENIGLNENGKGRPYSVLPMGEWMAKAVAAGLHPAVAALIEMMDTPGAPDYPKLGKIRRP